MIRAMKFVFKCADKLAVIAVAGKLHRPRTGRRFGSMTRQMTEPMAASLSCDRCSQRWQRWAWHLGLVPLAIAFWPLAIRPSSAAERITFSLGATIERSISVDAIEAYVKEGRVTPELAPYLAYIDPAMRVQAKGLLSQRADIDVTTVAQFAYTPQGEFLLAQAGEVFRTGARLPGGKGLRSAVILSAADEVNGLTILNVLRRFPTPVLRIDLPMGLAIASQASEAFNQSNAAIALVEQLSLQAATIPFPDGTSAADLNDLVTRPGLFQVKKLSVRLNVSPQPVDVYLPDTASPAVSARRLSQSRLAGFPAVIISHGLGSDRNSFAYLAKFLAERGFVAITLEHPGTNADRLNAFIAGRASQVPDEEFINRPLLISQVLDGLAERQAIDPELKNINFNNVGIIGQSFGGYTALAVAGAPINLAALTQVCPPSFSVNISLLLQCQAARLTPAQANQNFTDPRIRAVVAINPFASAIFGPDSIGKIDLPALIISGSADTVAPALPEQILPFTWMSESTDHRAIAPAGSAVAAATENRYLMIMEGATHFSTIGVTGAETFGLPANIIGPVPEVAQMYTQVMSFAFLEVYLAGDRRYQPVLTSAFTSRLSRPEMPISLISHLTPAQISAQVQPVTAAEPLDNASQNALDQLLLDRNVDLAHPQPFIQKLN